MQIVFVIGPYRSGTSLVYDILNAHPDVAVLYEAAFLHFWPRLRADHVSLEWAQDLDFWNGAFSRHGLSPGTFQEKQPRSREEAALAVYQEYAAQYGASIAGEKHPAYCDRIPSLAKAFPYAKFVICWRDPRYTLRSIAKYRHTSGSPGKNLGAYDLTFYCYDRLLRGIDWLKTHQRAFAVVDYDLVVENPEAALASMWDLLAVKPPAQPFVTRPQSLSAIPSQPHNEAARSGSLGHSTSESAVVPPSVLQRLARWQGLWSAEGLSNTLHSMGTGTRGFPLHCCIDQARAFLANCRLTFALLLFSVLPLNWWRSYRRRKSA